MGNKVTGFSPEPKKSKFKALQTNSQATVNDRYVSKFTSNTMLTNGEAKSQEIKKSVRMRGEERKMIEKRKAE